MPTLELWIVTHGGLDERKMQARFKSELRERFGTKIKIKLEGVAFGNTGSATIIFLLEFSKDFLAGALSGLFASWLYDRLKELRQQRSYEGAAIQTSPADDGRIVQYEWIEDKETIEKILRTVLERKPE